MKSEERHRLQTNELGQLVHKTGDALEQHATKLVAVVCAILVLAAAVTWWLRLSNASSSAAWTMLESAQNVDDFGNVADKFKNTPAGDWARLRESELNLKSGAEAMFTDRELALADLKRAREGFDQLLTSSNANQMIRERAEWGIARCLEATTDGETTKAIEAYQRLLTDFPDSVYKPLAEQRIAALKTGGAKEFYAWFSKQSPKPADIRPKDGILKGLNDGMLPSPTEGKPDSDKEKPPTTESSDSVKEDAEKGEPKSNEAGEGSKDIKPENKPAAEEQKEASKPEKASGEAAADKP